jgi:hypothetical protein
MHNYYLIFGSNKAVIGNFFAERPKKSKEVVLTITTLCQSTPHFMIRGENAESR